MNSYEPLMQIVYANALKFYWNDKNLEGISDCLHYFNKSAKFFRDKKNMFLRYSNEATDSEDKEYALLEYKKAQEELKSIYDLKESALSLLDKEGFIKPRGVQIMPTDGDFENYGLVYTINGRTFHASCSSAKAQTYPFLGHMKYGTNPY